jgi:molybdenum cofactor cytidylyltransferase
MARTAGVVLAAGGSRRLGTAKQLLPFRGATLLDAVLDRARACPFDQLLCVLGGSAADVRRTVDLRGVEVVDNPRFGDGCSSSIAAALPALHPATDVLVLLLGDQPGVRPGAVRTLLACRDGARLAVCRYEDGRGHPLAVGRRAFADLGRPHGDKAVWRLLDRHAGDVVEVPVAGRVPRDVDTWADFHALTG